uniref:UV excision repair protein RAD23 n=1 Tax=Blastobotrys adeninivorans TaxID=409370 RepID=A0A060SWZ8_BLAAD
MLLTLKDFKQQKWTIEIEPSETVLALKEKNAQEKGWEASLQKLIFSGKVLQDDRTLESYNIKEKDFIICMVSKPKKPAQSSESSKAASTPEPSTPARAPPTASTNAPGPAASGATGAAEVATPTAPQSSQPASFNDPSAFAVGSQRESAINNIVEMGYPRDQVEVAMRAAFNNPDRAVEYLLTGIPEDVRPPQQQGQGAEDAEGQHGDEGEDIEIEHEGEDAEHGAGDNEEGAGEDVNLFDAAAAAAQGRGGGAQGGAGGAGAGAGAGGADLSFLQHHPQFQQMRELIRQQPQMLEVIIQQLAAANPQLAQLIASNPEGFINLLRGPEDEEGGELPPGVTQIQVTPEENDAIERLVALGFSRDIVIQAYFACDKNEEVAANYLFEHGHDDDE